MTHTHMYPKVIYPKYYDKYDYPLAHAWMSFVCSLAYFDPVKLFFKAKKWPFPSFYINQLLTAECRPWNEHKLQFCFSFIHENMKKYTYTVINLLDRLSNLSKNENIQDAFEFSKYLYMSFYIT